MMDITAVANQLLTATDAAALLKCPLEHVRLLRANGDLAAFYMGTQPVFRLRDVRSLQRRKAAVAPQQASRRSRCFGSGRQQSRLVHAVLSDTACLSEASPPALQGAARDGLFAVANTNCVYSPIGSDGVTERLASRFLGCP
jgi:hypothetical protein